MTEVENARARTGGDESRFAHVCDPAHGTCVLCTAVPSVHTCLWLTNGTPFVHTDAPFIRTCV